MTDVANNRTLHRYELAVDGHLAAAYYGIADGVITFEWAMSDARQRADGR